MRFHHYQNCLLPRTFSIILSVDFSTSIWKSHFLQLLPLKSQKNNMKFHKYMYMFFLCETFTSTNINMCVCVCVCVCVCKCVCLCVCVCVLQPFSSKVLNAVNSNLYILSALNEINICMVTGFYVLRCKYLTQKNKKTSSQIFDFFWNFVLCF